MQWLSLGGDAESINPLSPAELVIDHSVQVDNYGTANALDLNTKIEFKRNQERYSFLRWGQGAFDNFRRCATKHRHRASGKR